MAAHGSSAMPYSLANMLKEGSQHLGGNAASAVRHIEVRPAAPPPWLPPGPCRGRRCPRPPAVI